MGETVVIDLGELRDPVEPQARPTRPSAACRNTALLLAALLVAVLGGAAPAPSRPALIPLAAGDSAVLTDDRYHVFAPDAVRSGAGVLSTYEVPAGRLVSRISTRLPGQLLGVQQVGEVLLAHHAVETDVENGSRMTAVDAGTGVIRWTRPGNKAGLSPSGRSVVVSDYVEDKEDRWAAIDVATGQLRWTFAVDLKDITSIPWEGHSVSRLVMVRASGRVEVRDTETGTVTAAANLPSATIIPDGGATVWTSNGLLLIGTAGGLNGYGLDRLDLRWRNETLGSVNGFVNPACGDVICLDSGAGMRAIDPATGQVRWSSEGQWSAHHRSGHYLLSGPVNGPDDSGPHMVIDVVTGQPRGTFGRWQPGGPPRRGGRLIGLSRQPGGDLWYALLDPGALSVRVLGVVSGTYGGCDIGSTAMVCRRFDGAASVWPLPPV